MRGNSIDLRRVVRIIVFALIISALAFALLEISLRLLKPRHHGLRTLLHKSTLQTDYSRINTLPDLMDQSIIGFRPQEEVAGFVLNSRGLRTIEYSEAKAEGTYRVAALGDSFTFGGVPTKDHWTSVLEKTITRCRAERTEVLRLGVPSTGPPFQLRLWQLEGARLGADLVILGFFVGNDFFDEQGRLPGWRGWLDQLSTLSYAALALRNLGRLSGFEAPPPRHPSDTPSGEKRQTGGFEVPGYAQDFEQGQMRFSRRRFLRIEAERMSLCLKDEQWKLNFRFDRVARFLTEMHREVTDSGARFLILIMPDEYQVNDSLRRSVAEFAGRSEGDYDIWAPQRRLMGFCNNNGIECFDLLPAFRLKNEERRLYLRRDTHWNQAGNRLAGRELGSYLCESESD